MEEPERVLGLAAQDFLKTGNMVDYGKNDIIRAYENVGVERGRVVVLRTDLRFLGRFANLGREAILSAHFQALADLVDLSVGTIVVPTGTPSLFNTDKVFESATTRSEMGALTEYIRTRPGAVRNFHPFVSYVAIGHYADFLCRKTSRHCFGPHTPEARLIELDGLDIGVGLHPRRGSSSVHHIEQIMGVPYRYTKEFVHPVMRDGVIRREPFYAFVRYRECDITRNMNKKIFERFQADGYEVKKAPLGRGKIYSMSIKDYFVSVSAALRDDIYMWLDKPPAIRPYRT